MTKCCDKSCSCKLQAVDDSLGNDSIVITGTGTQQDPFHISFRGLAVTDTDDIDLTLTYGGTGYSLSAAFASTSNLDSIGDVNASAPTNGQVLSWNTSTGKWVPAAPTTAAAGSVNHDNSVSGDGSVGTPLAVRHDPALGTRTTASGIGLTDAMMNSLVRRFTNAAARTAATPAPSLNSLSALDTAPGRIDYWDGSAWKPLVKVVNITGTQYLNNSGAYDGRPVTLFVKQLSVSTDAAGVFTALDTTDLTGFAGVLSVTIMPKTTLVATDAWFPTLETAPSGDVQARAWASDGGGPLASSTIVAVVTATLY